MENSPAWIQEIREIRSLLELQLKLTGELLRVCRHGDLSAAFAVDALNGLYGRLGEIPQGPQMSQRST